MNPRYLPKDEKVCSNSKHEALYYTLQKDRDIESSSTQLTTICL